MVLCFIGENIELDNNRYISRGVPQDTDMGSDVKIDYQSHIAHNLNMRRGPLLISGSKLDGIVMVGRFTWIGTGLVLKEEVSVDDYVTKGISPCVSKNVGCNVTVAGNSSRRDNK